MKIDSCACGSCPVLEKTGDSAYRAACYNEDCVYYALFTLADKDKSFVLDQWNAVSNSRKLDEKDNDT